VSEIWPLSAVLPAATPQPLTNGDHPVPVGRARWRLTLHQRQWNATTTLDDTMLAEITTARSRQLSHDLNKPAELRFSLDGRDPAAALVQEFSTDVMAWRWDEQTGADICVGRFIIDQSQDTITEQADTVNFVGHSYEAMLAQRLMTADTTRYGSPDPSVDQDTIVNNLVGMAKSTSSSGGAGQSASMDIQTGAVTPQPTPVSFVPGSYLPLDVALCFSSGDTGRPLSGQLRDRTYRGGQQIGSAISDLAAVINGFDYDVIPGARVGLNVDQLRIFYPYQGVLRSQPALVYGPTVSTISRSVNAATFGNYWRIVGNNQSSAETDPQVFAERWDSEVNNTTVVPTGLWMKSDNSANSADVSTQSTLNAATEGKLDGAAAVIPAYTLGLAPGAYSWGNPNLGDEVPLVIHAGRLNIGGGDDPVYVRVVSIAYDIQDNGYEAVTLGVGQPLITFHDMLRRLGSSIDALTRR
jgi:hypothetical protein